MTTPLESEFIFRCSADSGINEHLPRLRELAAQCEHVTEFGVGHANVIGSSSVAFLAAGPEKLVSYDIIQHPDLLKIAAVKGRKTKWHFIQQDVLEATIEETDLLFIDTWHVYEQLKAEFRLHACKVRRWIVLHDTTTYGEQGESGVGYLGLWPAVEEFLERGTFRLVERLTNNNGLAILERCAPESEAKPEKEYQPARIFLGMPCYGGIVPESLASLDNAVVPWEKDGYVKSWEISSFHCRNFNQLWCNALNGRDKFGWTHFAMIHQDVRPHGFWLSTMLREMRKHGVDLLSVVLPIKNECALTSTALLFENGILERLTMRKVMTLPETFTSALAKLLISSGLWICDFTKPWVEEVWFETRDRIVKNPDGTFKPETVSEDWHFSNLLNKLGVKIMATRAVPCGHWGQCEYRNDSAWGTLETDPDAAAYGEWWQW